MRILHVIPSFSLVHGGPTRALALMERALSAEGVCVETATSDDDGPERRFDRPIGVPVSENGVIRRYFPKRFEFYKYCPGLAHWLRLHVKDYDLVHIHALFSHSSMAAARAARRAGVPYVLRPLGTLARYGFTQRRPWLKRASLALFEGPALRAAAAVHFTSEAERKEAESLGIPMRGVVLPLGVEALEDADADLLRQRWNELGDAPYLLYLSRLDPKKNLEGLLAAWAKLMLDYPNWRLVIAGAGDPDYTARLHAIAHEQRLAGSVLWTGHLEGGLKAAALKGARAFVLPSFSENFGIAAAEALHAGLPCVLGQGVAIAAQVERAGAGMTTAPDAQSVAAALRRIMQAEAAEHEAWSSAARRLAEENFSARAMGKALVSLYSEILAR